MASRDFSEPQSAVLKGSLEINAANSLDGITEARLARFADADLKEVFEVFVLGWYVFDFFEQLSPSHVLFGEAKSDLITSSVLLNGRPPNYGQSRWASLQAAEKFLKGLIHNFSAIQPSYGHVLDKIYQELVGANADPNILSLLSDIQVEAGVRYGEINSSKEEAYIGHKSCLSLIHELGNVYLPKK